MLCWVIDVPSVFPGPSVENEWQDSRDGAGSPLGGLLQNPDRDDGLG